MSILKSSIIKTELPDHFPIAFALKTNEAAQNPKVNYNYCEKYALCGVNWDAIKKFEVSSKAYKYFFDTFVIIYGQS